MSWSYGTSFAVLMFVCGIGCLVAAAVILDSVDASAVHGLLALGLIAVAPLVLGTLYDTRFDLWPLMLTLGALAVPPRGRAGVGGLLLGVAVAAKLWPLVLAPIGLAYVWRRLGRHAAFVASASFVGAAALCVVPFAVLAPGGVWHSLTEQLRRPLQVESLGASVLMAFHHIGGLSLTTVSTHGSQNLSGSFADVGPAPRRRRSRSRRSSASGSRSRGNASRAPSRCSSHAARPWPCSSRSGRCSRHSS